MPSSVVLRFYDSVIEEISIPEKELDATANKIADNARRFVPIDTGALKASIRVLSFGQKDTRYVTAGGAAGVDYAAFVEFGTSKMEAQPYMRPAIDGVTL